METIAAPLHLVIYMSRALESSESIDNAIRTYIEAESTDISRQLADFYSHWLRTKSAHYPVKEAQHYRKAIFEALYLGLQGRAIYQIIKQIEEELVIACENQINQQTAQLPFVLLLPLLLLQTPAFLLLLFGPLMDELSGIFQ